MFSRIAVLSNAAFLSPSDRLMNLFFKMRVRSDVGDNFKLDSLSLIRSSGLYKRLKMKPVQILAFERNLIRDNLNAMSLVVLCAFYDISIDVIESNYMITCGQPSYAFKNEQITKRVDSDMYVHNPLKPLYAVSHYTLGELKCIANKLKLKGVTKTQLHTAITNCFNAV